MALSYLDGILGPEIECPYRNTNRLVSLRNSTIRLESAGGIVHRDGQGAAEVVLCGRESPPIWALPKGTPEPGETREQTALREVMEETGLQVEQDEYVGSIHYWFLRPKDHVRCQKTVYYYLMRPVGGDTSLHDNEFDEVRWFPANKALEILTYKNEVRIVEKGLTMASE